jgi:hypothetical protein
MMRGRFARTWKAFRTPSEPPQIHVHVDSSVSADQIKRLTGQVEAQMLRRARRNGFPLTRGL